jgi:ubiquitin carboxyl-terminal hydrolase L3
MALPSAPSASPPASADERWPPLESSPEVFNQVPLLLCTFFNINSMGLALASLTSLRLLPRTQFMWSLGVPEDEAEFHDVYGLDADALGMVPQPVLAVILCFPDPPQVRAMYAA